MDDLAQSNELDSKFFWYLIDKQKGRRFGVTPIHDDNGKMLTDVTEIRKEWSDYFENLLCSDNNEFDVLNEFDSHVNETVYNRNIQKCF